MGAILDALPNILTAANLACGIGAICLAGRGDPGRACWLVILATFFDGLDGWTARRFGRESRFGRFFDSAADFVSFGCAPVVIYVSLPAGNGKATLLFPALYVAASALRLIRFAAGNDNGADRGGDFMGLPVTACGAVLASILLFFPGNSLGTAFYAGLFAVLSVLMLSRVRFRRLNR